MPDVSFSLELAPLRLRHRRIFPRCEGMRRSVKDCLVKRYWSSPSAAKSSSPVPRSKHIDGKELLVGENPTGTLLEYFTTWV